MKLKPWQLLELTGAGLVLIALFLQLFSSWNIDNNLRASDSAVMEDRLSHIYQYLVEGTERAPPWDQIEEFHVGKRTPNDGHFRFDEVSTFLRHINAILFALGAFMSLVGKVLEFKEENERKNEERDA